MTTTTRRSPASRVRPHQFEPDPLVPADWRRREFCQRCRLPGQPGDDRHPAGAPPRFRETPPEVAEVERRRLGERDDE